LELAQEILKRNHIEAESLIKGFDTKDLEEEEAENLVIA
jgi:hypothetical protein